MCYKKMKKTFITKIPDKPGSFLKTVKIISELGLNITRVSYNNSIDTNTLFVEVAGESDDIKKAYSILKNDGFLFKEDNANVILMEFKMMDKPGILLPILELIHQYNFNISYISSQENSTDYQYFRMALYIDNPYKVDDFLKNVTNLCEVRIITYDKTEKNLDNTVFYISFANGAAKKLDLNKDKINDLISNSNLIMQILDEKNLSPYKTFEYIAKFADLLSKYRGLNFAPRISTRCFKDYTIHAIEPECGSNTYIIENKEGLIFVDSGFAIYKDEMVKLLSVMFDDFTNRKKTLIITHPDIDHLGLVSLFDKIYVNQIMYENFKLENEQRPNFREQYRNHEPYVKISKILSKYTPPLMQQLIVVDDLQQRDNTMIGETIINGLHFQFYNGNGGHSKGEMIITLDNIVFPGDIIVNPTGYTTEQKEFNQLAPYLMSSVNMDSKLAKYERELVQKKLTDENVVCYGHGTPYWGPSL